MVKKSIAKNYIYNLIYQMLIIILPIITIPYLSRVLGPENLGISSFTTSIAMYFILFGTLGVGLYAQREIAYVQESIKDKTKVFYEIVILRLITMLISIIIFYFTFARTGEYEIYYKILLIQLLANCFDISWFFQGQEDFKKVVLRNIIVKILGIILIFTFVKTQSDLWKYMLIVVSTEFIGNGTLWFYLPKYLEKISLRNLNIFRHLCPVISFFVPQIAIQVYTLLDKTMLGLIIDNMSEVGIYEYSQRIVKIVLTIITSLGIVVAPRIANVFSNGEKEEVSKYLKKSVNFVWFLGIPLMFGLMGVAKCFSIWFLGESFKGVGELIIYASPLILAIGLNNVTGIQYLLQVKKQNIFTISVICGAVINFVLNLFFIPLWLSKGAVIASVTAEFLILIIQIIYIKRNKQVDVSNWFKISFKYWIAGVIMLITLVLINEKVVLGMYNTALQVFVGTVEYFVILILLKDKFTLNIIDIIKKKIFKR